MKPKITPMLLLLALGLAAGQANTIPAVENTVYAATSTSVSKLETTQANLDAVSLNKKTLKRAKDTQYQLSLENADDLAGTYSLTFTSSKPEIAEVDVAGVITTKATGKTKITCVVTSVYGETKTLTCTVTVTDPSFTEDTYVIDPAKQLKLTLSGTTTKKCMLTSANKKIAKVMTKKNMTIKAVTEGVTYITATVDGRIIQCKVVVGDSSQAVDSDDTSQTTDTTETTDSNQDSTTTDTSTDSTDTTGSDTGSEDTTESDSESSSTNSATSASETALQAIENAYNAIGAAYSQTYRMEEGYYDCSSLVYRCFAAAGFTFGLSSDATNAPTAAAEGQYLYENNMSIADEYVEESELLPGDVIFTSSGGTNNRFRNINHTAIYIGNNQIIHATSSGVKIGSYSYYKKLVVLIGRIS